MSVLGRLLWVTGALSLALFACLAVMAMGWLEASGIGVFDGNLSGYSVSAARAYLNAVNEDQIALYVGWFHRLDTVLPITLAFTIGGVIWSLGPRGLLGVLTALTPLAYCYLDLAENVAVAAMLRAGPRATDALILQASAYTTSKWISLALALLLAVWAWRIKSKEAGLQ